MLVLNHRFVFCRPRGVYSGGSLSTDGVMSSVSHRFQLLQVSNSRVTASFSNRDSGPALPFRTKFKTNLFEQTKVAELEHSNSVSFSFFSMELSSSSSCEYCDVVCSDCSALGHKSSTSRNSTNNHLSSTVSKDLFVFWAKSVSLKSVRCSNELCCRLVSNGQSAYVHVFVPAYAKCQRLPVKCRGAKGMDVARPAAAHAYGNPRESVFNSSTPPGPPPRPGPAAAPSPDHYGVRRPHANEVRLLRNEAVRLKTFRTWPSTSPVAKEALAKAGFFYFNDGDRVQCVFCLKIAHGWRATHDPTIIHRALNPRCPFVLGLPIGNVPIGSSTAGPANSTPAFTSPYPSGPGAPQVRPNAIPEKGYCLATSSTLNSFM
jgi:hypothetical protein